MLDRCRCPTFCTSVKRIPLLERHSISWNTLRSHTSRTQTRITPYGVVLQGTVFTDPNLPSLLPHQRQHLYRSIASWGTAHSSQRNHGLVLCSHAGGITQCRCFGHWTGSIWKAVWILSATGLPQILSIWCKAYVRCVDGGDSTVRRPSIAILT